MTEQKSNKCPKCQAEIGIMHVEDDTHTYNEKKVCKCTMKESMYRLNRMVMELDAPVVIIKEEARRVYQQACVNYSNRLK